LIVRGKPEDDKWKTIRRLREGGDEFAGFEISEARDNGGIALRGACNSHREEGIPISGEKRRKPLDSQDRAEDGLVSTVDRGNENVGLVFTGSFKFGP
jgi:hypothetical protein